MSCGVGLRCSSDLAMLWLWCRLATAAPIPSLAWELPLCPKAVKRKERRGREKRKEKERVQTSMVRVRGKIVKSLSWDIY